MAVPPYFPYRSAEARAIYLSFYDRSAKDWPVAWESRMVPGAFGETFVRISGPAAADPLVLLPGLNTSSQFWEPNIEALSAGYRTYAVDRLGDVGRSVCTTRIADIAGLLRWLDETFTALEPGRKINLLGLSYGGWLAALYALRFPDRLRKLVLLAPGGTVLRTSLAMYLHAIPILTGRPAAMRRFVEWLLQDVARKDPSRVGISLNRLQLTNRCYRPRRIAGPTLFTDAELAGLRVPTLFVVGEHEKIYSAAKALARLHRAAPQIQTELIPGAGHDLTVAQPELLHRAILDFLARP